MLAKRIQNTGEAFSSMKSVIEKNKADSTDASIRARDLQRWKHA